MKVLQVTRAPAYPPSSGATQRFHGLVSGHGDHEVVRYAQCPLNSVDDTDVFVEVEDGYREFRTTNRPNSVLGMLTGKLDAPQFLMSPLMRFGNPERFEAFLADSDVVVVEEPWQFDYVYERTHEDMPVVFSSHNFEPELYRHLADSPFTKPLHRIVQSVERRAVQRADLVVVTSERDKHLYRSEYEASGPFHIAYNAASLPTERASDATKMSVSGPNGPPVDATWTLFVGTNHGPNVEGIRRLTELMQAGAISEDVHLIVVGTAGSAFDVARLPDNVHLPGFVDNLPRYYKAADIGVNPITTGSGSNVKVPEYLSYGLPVVTTPFGARGLPVKDGEHVFIAELDSFGNAIDELRSSPEEMQALGYRGQALVEAELTWEAVSGSLFEELSGLAKTVPSAKG